MNRSLGGKKPFFRHSAQKKGMPWGNKVVIDTESEQIYFPEYMLPPLGYQEEINIEKGTRICEILESTLAEYVNGFIDYFIHDPESLKQCLNILSLKDSLDSALIKKITFEYSSTYGTASGDLDTSQSGNYYGKSSSCVNRSTQSSPFTPRNSIPSTAVSSQGRDYSDRGTHSEQSSQQGPYSSSGWNGYQRNHTTNPQGHSLSTGESINTPPNYSYSSVSSPSLNPDLELMLSGMYTPHDTDRTDEAHYMKVSQYRSFFNLTKLITEVPVLGSDIMTAPQIMLLMLDDKVVPLLFEIIDRIIKAGCPTDPAMVAEWFQKMYDSDTVCKDYSSVNLYLENALSNAQCTNSLEYQGNKSEIRNFQFTTRLCNIPPTLPLWKHTLDQITDNDVGNMVALVATVTRVGAISVLDEEREYTCTKCRQSVVAKAVPELHYFISVPTKCTHWSSEGDQRGRKCFGDTFIRGAATKRTDIQEIRCQSIARGTNVAYVGGTTPVLLRRDITGTCVPGDNIHIIAFVRRRWNTLRNGKRCESHIFLDAINIEVMNLHKLSVTSPIAPLYDGMYYPFWAMYRDDEVAGRNKILQSMWTTLIGVDNAKLAMLLTIIGGCPLNQTTVFEEAKVNKWAKYAADKRNMEALANVGQQLTHQQEKKSETKLLRTQCHILLVGCPGTGKSQLLKYAKTLVDRHVSVSGTNCSSAGLTCTVIRDGSNSMLSAGALVLADGGLCCIDEFALIHSDDKACLHEAMEQQVISVAKVGIKCSLNCRCTVIAASNFKVAKGKNLNSYEDIDNLCMPQDNPVINIDVPLPLLSRFDLILVFTENPLNDDELMEFLLKDLSSVPSDSPQKEESSVKRHGGENHETNEAQKRASQYDDDRNPHIIDWAGVNAIKDYVEFIKSSVFPVFTESAKTVIHAYYLALRVQAHDTGYQGGPTIRTIESLIRLSQAHARLMLRDHVSVFDTVSVIWMGEFGLQGYKVGACSGTDQVVERQGLFPNVKELFNAFCRRQKAMGCPHEAKMGNGITTMEMYSYFEDILMQKVHLTRVEANDDAIGVYSEKESDPFVQY